MIFIWWGILSVFHLLVSGLSFWTIHKSRSNVFRAPFYRLCQSDLIINILCHIHSWIKRCSTDDELSRYLIPIAKNAEPLLMINDFLSQLFYHIQSISVLTKVICQYQATRDATILIPWQKYWPWTILLNIVASCFITTPYVIVSKLKTVFYDPETDKLIYDSSRWTAAYYIMDIEVFFYLFSICGIGALTFFVLHIHPTWNESKRMRVNVTFLTVINAIIHLMVYAWHFIPRFIPMEKSTKVIMLFCVSDLMTCTLPYLLFICDSKFRKSFLLLVFKYKATEIQPSQIAMYERTSVLPSRF